MIKTHELYELAQRGCLLHDDFWTPETIRRAAKYDMGSHLNMPGTLVHAGEAMLKAGALRLPAEHVIFEYDTADQQFERFALLCWQVDECPDSDWPGLVACAPLIRRAERWSEFMMALWFSFAGEMRIQLSDALESPDDVEFREQLQTMAYALTVGAIAALQPGAARIEIVSAPNGLNRKRAKAGKPPIFDHWSVTIARVDH